MDIDKARNLVEELLKLMKQRSASDLFLTAGFPPAVKIDGEVTSVMDKPLSREQVDTVVHSIMNEAQTEAFDQTGECQFALRTDVGRFRVSAFVQQGRSGAVLRVIETEIPTLEALDLPETLRDVVMAKRGLVIFVGATGSGKSTSLAAMLGHRNHNSAGHIISIEDPIEYVHPHGKSIVTQRELGVDTESWDAALRNTLRQAPDVILIGEIRSRETMEYAIQFAETGHLVLSTLHGNNANQALDRIINFFPEEKREQVLMDLSLNLQAMISQRLVRREEGGRVAALEIMRNTPRVADLVFRGDVGQLKEVMHRGAEQGMITFDQFLFNLYDAYVISYEEALRNADSQNELRLNVKLNSQRGGQDLDADEQVNALRMQRDDDGQDELPEES